MFLVIHAENAEDEQALKQRTSNYYIRSFSCRCVT